MLSAILINTFAVILSFGVLPVYYNTNTYFDLTNLNKLISEHLIVLMFVFIISFISLYLYDTDDRYNNRSKNNFSMSLFRFISKFIHMTTVIIICDSLFIDNFLGLEFHDNILLIALFSY